MSHVGELIVPSPQIEQDCKIQTICSLSTLRSASLLEIDSEVRSAKLSSSNSNDSFGGDIFDEAECLYSVLIGSSTSPVLFGWWPKPQGWEYAELVERTTRCLPAVRPGVDLVALPSLPEVEELYSCWAQQNGMADWQALWFAPRLDSGEEHTDCRELPKLVCQEVFAKIPSDMPLDKLCFCPMYLVPDIRQLAKNQGIRVVGDEAQHAMGPLSSAKAWLHPHIDPERWAPSLRDCNIETSGARGPRGYIASSTDGLLRALRTLRAEMPSGTKFVLKPSWASGGEGIIIGVTETDLEGFTFPSEVDCTAILEEMIEGISDLQSPTLYMIGSEPCGALADQILSGGGAVNDGNRWPSALPDAVTQTCVSAAKAVQQVWNLSSQWGLDFVLDRHGAPIIVDLNMGRPNGNFAVRLWESRSRQRLFLHTSSWLVPTGLRAVAFSKLLERHGLLWNAETMQGVMIYQHHPGHVSSFVVASADGWAAVEDLLTKFKMVMAELSEE